MPMTSIQNIQT